MKNDNKICQKNKLMMKKVEEQSEKGGKGHDGPVLASLSFSYINERKRRKGWDTKVPR